MKKIVDCGITYTETGENTVHVHIGDTHANYSKDFAIRFAAALLYVAGKGDLIGGLRDGRTWINEQNDFYKAYCEFIDQEMHRPEFIDIGNPVESQEETIIRLKERVAFLESRVLTPQERRQAQR